MRLAVVGGSPSVREELLRLVGRAQVQLEGPGSAAAEESLRSALALARRTGESEVA